MSTVTYTESPVWPEPQFAFREAAISLPLSPLDFVEFFKDKSQGKIPMFLVDVKSSLAKMKTYTAMLRFLNNGKMAACFDSIPSKMLAEYTRLNINLQSPDLMEAHANVLYWFKYGELLFPDSAMTAQRCGMFLHFHRESVIRQCQFLDSMLLFLMSESSEEGEDLQGFKVSSLEVTNARKSKADRYAETHATDDGIYLDIGLPLLRLLNIPDFVFGWYRDGMPFSAQILFTRHFKESMYEGKPLFAFVATSPLMAVLRLPLISTDRARELELLLRKVQEEHPEEDFAVLGNFLEHHTLAVGVDDAGQE